MTPQGQPVFVGIEVKYHENLNNKPSRHHSRYDEVADMMGCFLPDARERLRGKPLQQIWRDHLLAGAHGAVDGFADGFFAFLCPAGNEACSAAVADYRRCLGCDETFMHWGMEAVVEAIGRRPDEPWVGSFVDRYLAFEKVNTAIEAPEPSR